MCSHYKPLPFFFFIQFDIVITMSDPINNLKLNYIVNLIEKFINIIVDFNMNFSKCEGIMYRNVTIKKNCSVNMA